MTLSVLLVTMTVNGCTVTPCMPHLTIVTRTGFKHDQSVLTDLWTPHPFWDHVWDTVDGKLCDSRLLTNTASCTWQWKIGHLRLAIHTLFYMIAIFSHIYIRILTNSDLRCLFFLHYKNTGHWWLDPCSRASRGYLYINLIKKHAFIHRHFKTDNVTGSMCKPLRGGRSQWKGY